MLLRIWMIVWKEFVQIFRDPRTLAIVVVLPVLLLVIYGYAINLDVDQIWLCVYDQDRSRPSRELIEGFTSGGYFRLVHYAEGYDEATHTLDDGVAKVALIIPPTYAQDLAAGREAQVQLVVDGSDSTTASTAIGYVNAIMEQQSTRVTVEALARQGLNLRAVAPLDARVRSWYNPELRSANYIVPGLIAIILMLLSALLTSMTIVREKERGTLEQLIVSPLLPGELMLGKVI